MLIFIIDDFTTLHRPHLQDFTGFVLVVVVIDESISFSVAANNFCPCVCRHNFERSL